MEESIAGQPRMNFTMFGTTFVQESIAGQLRNSFTAQSFLETGLLHAVGPLPRRLGLLPRMSATLPAMEHAKERVHPSS